MPLSAYEPPTKEVLVGETSVRIRGLSTNDLSVLIHTHLADASAIMDLFEGKNIFASSGADKILLTLVKDAPGLTANIIAMACGEPDEAKRVLTMPGPTQLQLLIAIADMSFKEVGGIKKFMDQIKEVQKLVPPDLMNSLTSKPNQTSTMS